MENHATLLSATKSTRIEWIDILKGIGILLVVLGHSFANGQTGDIEACMIVKSIIYGFHMPLFFVAAGAAAYLSMNKLKSTQSYMLRLGYGVLLPYVCYAFLAGFIFINPEKWLSFSWKFQMDALLRGTVEMWFLPALLLLQICYCIYYKITERINNDWLQILLTLPFFIALFALHRAFGKLSEADTATAILWTSNAYKAFIPFFFGSIILRYDWTKKLIYQNNIVYMLSLIFVLVFIQLYPSCPYSQYIRALLGVFVSIVLIRYTQQYKTNQFIKSQLILLGKNSLCIYLFAGLFQVSYLVFDLPGIHPLLVVVVYGSLSLLACYVCVFFARFIEISPVLRLCFLGKK